jgi:hypothetical protein
MTNSEEVAFQAICEHEDKRWLEEVQRMLPIWKRAECKRFNKKKKQRRARCK